MFTRGAGPLLRQRSGYVLFPDEAQADQPVANPSLAGLPLRLQGSLQLRVAHQPARQHQQAQRQAVSDTTP